MKIHSVFPAFCVNYSREMILGYADLSRGLWIFGGQTEWAMGDKNREQKIYSPTQTLFDHVTLSKHIHEEDLENLGTEEILKSGRNNSNYYDYFVGHCGAFWGLNWRIWRAKIQAWCIVYFHWVKTKAIQLVNARVIVQTVLL